jgi:uncharacterized protein YhbP (UPF0306 family)
MIAFQDKDVWVSNVYYGVDNELKFYFISNEKTKHSKQIMKNSGVAFSVVWFNEKDHRDRKAVQGKGTCRIAMSEEEIKRGVELHNRYFPEFAEKITIDWVKNNKNKSHVWIVEPSYIKHWDDSMYGQDGTKEFRFQ